MTMEKTPEVLDNNHDDLVIQTKGLTKRFSNVVANDNVSVDVRKGEIHCFLGENGAGKSTLSECLYGFYQPDSGQILFKGKPVKISSPSVAIDLGIGMVHQHFVLIEPLTVIENIVLGTEPMGIFPKLGEAEEKIQALCDSYGVDLNLHAQIWQLSVGQQQWVEILKALYVGIDLLILDEPTAVLTPQESERLFEVLQQMKAKGLSIIFITHKLKEVMRVSDRVTVLRKGKLIDTVNTADMTREDLACMMVGREVVFRVEKEHVERGEPILQIKDLYVKNDWNQNALCGINLTVHKGEIVGVAGVGGNGQKELFEALIGIRKADRGEVRLKDELITQLSPREIMTRGIGHVPEDRIRMGLIPDFSVAENLVLGHHRDSPVRKGLNIDSGYMKAFAEQCVEDFDIMTPSIDQQTQFLSGGNQQKVILARELNQKPQIILTNQPTRGLDVGVIEYVHEQLLEMRKEGGGILLFSEDLDEILNLSDRIAVLYKGEIMGIMDAKEARVDEIGLMMAGCTEDEL